MVTINLQSSATNTLLSATESSQKGDVYVASTALGVTAATGSRVGVHENTQGGVLVVGLTITQIQGQTVTFALPAGWYFGVRRTTGTTMTIVNAFDQAVG